MELHLVHTLILTHFEASLINPNSWEEVIAQDFTVHALYCRETKNLLFHSDYQKSDPIEEISKIEQILKMTGNCVKIEKQIIILRDDENEYCANDVIKYFQ
jgi:hypothetical protein